MSMYLDNRQTNNERLFYLFCQLFFAKLVEREELSCQGDVFKEPAAGKLHSDDDLTIGDHHGHVPELNLK